MNNSIFRDKSLKRLNAPEQLMDYIKIANPAGWMIVLLAALWTAAVTVFFLFHPIEITSPTIIIVTDGVATGYIPDKAGYDPAAGMKILMNGDIYHISCVSDKTVNVSPDTDSAICLLEGLKNGGICRTYELKERDLDNGIYKATITTSYLSPVTTLVNAGGDR